MPTNSSSVTPASTNTVLTIRIASYRSQRNSSAANENRQFHQPVLKSFNCAIISYVCLPFSTSLEPCQPLFAAITCAAFYRHRSAPTYLSMAQWVEPLQYSHEDWLHIHYRSRKLKDRLSHHCKFVRHRKERRKCRSLAVITSKIHRLHISDWSVVDKKGRSCPFFVVHCHDRFVVIDTTG